jgi:hypothetical protein
MLIFSDCTNDPDGWMSELSSVKPSYHSMDYRRNHSYVSLLSPVSLLSAYLLVLDIGNLVSQMIYPSDQLLRHYITSTTSYPPSTQIR